MREKKGATFLHLASCPVALFPLFHRNIFTCQSFLCGPLSWTNSKMKCFFCSDDQNASKCAECIIVYCSKHKDYHKPENLKKCLPWKVDKFDVVGRVLKASESVKKGRLIMFDRAFAMGPLMMPACLGVYNLRNKNY